MQPDLLREQRFLNWFHSGLILLAMALVMTLLGWTVAGGPGVVISLLMGALFLTFGPQISSRVLLRAQRARPIHPASAPELYDIVQRISEKAGLTDSPTLYHVPSPTLNAFAVGGRREPSIGISDGILHTLAPRELTGVLAHEISHIRAGDMGTLTLASVVRRLTRFLSTVGLLLLFFNLPLILLGVGSIGWTVPLVLFAAPTVSDLLLLALSRTREFAADIEAARLTDDPAGLASALEKLERSAQGGWWRLFLPSREVPGLDWLRTHPPTEERVRRLLALRGEAAAIPTAAPAPRRLPSSAVPVPPARRPDPLEQILEEVFAHFGRPPSSYSRYGERPRRKESNTFVPWRWDLLARHPFVS